MHYYYCILLAALIAQSGICSADEYFEWTEEHVTLTSETPSWTLDMIANGTKYIIEIDNTTDSAYSIFVWIDKMSCRRWEDTFEPNYIKVTSDKVIPDFDVCDNLTTSMSSPYNDGIENAGLRKVILTPLGVWADVSTSASLRVEMQSIKKTIVMGNDILQLDLTLDGSVDYEIQLNKKDKLCNQAMDKRRSWNCSLSLALIQMTCSSFGSNLQLNWTNLAGIKKSVQWCDNFTYTSSNLKSIESFDSIFLSAHRNITQNGEKPIKVSISTQLSTEDKSSCPSGYFNCNENCHTSESSNYDKYDKHDKLTGSHCIPEEWTCDNKPNCPNACPDADESDDYCTYWWYYEYYTSGLFGMWQFFFFFMFAAGFLTLFCVFRSLYLRRMKNRRNTRSVEDRVPRSDVAPPSYSKATGMPVPTYT